MLKQYFVLMRPHHAVKNIFIFLPLFFSLQLFRLEVFFQVFLAFAAFSFVQSGVYIFNDYHDREEDRLHPTKRFRPLASGAVSPFGAFVLMFVLLFLGGIVLSVLSFHALLWTLGYVVLTSFYTFFFKHVPLLDVFVLALGFVIRIEIGASVVGVPLTAWIIVVTFLLAVFMALGKRREDVLLYLSEGTKTRKVADGYSIEFLNFAMGTMASVIVVAYLMHTITYRTPFVHSSFFFSGYDLIPLFPFTTFFVLLGILRYMYLVLQSDVKNTSPVFIFFHDRFLQIVIFVWVIVVGAILY